MDRMPNFFIVGAARSGTTSLDRYLNEHPEIYIAPQKEVHFFASDHLLCTGPGDERLNRRVIRAADQYAQLFAGVSGEKAIGEASVFYLCLPGIAERIARAAPEAKLIILLREPVDRAYSAYMHLVRDGRETLGFAEGLNREEERKRAGFEPMWWYKELGLYYGQVKRYLDVFDSQHVKVLLYDDLRADPGRVLRDVFAFLGVKEDIAINTSMRHNVAGVPKSRILYTFLDNFITKPNALESLIKSLIPSRVRVVGANKATRILLRPAPIDPEMQAELTEYFAEDLGKLEDLLHRELLSWRHQLPSTAGT